MLFYLLFIFITVNIKIKNNRFKMNETNSLNQRPLNTTSPVAPNSTRIRRQQLTALSELPRVDHEMVNSVALDSFIRSIEYSNLPSRTTSNLVIVVLISDAIFFCKKIKDPIPFTVANSLLREEGFPVAETRIFNMNTTTSTQMALKLTQTINQTATPGSPSNADRWEQNLRNRWNHEAPTHPYLLVSSKVPGTPFNFIASDLLCLFLRNRTFYDQIGKMIFLDALLGNRDRLNETTCNGGNFLIIEEQGRISLGLIDHTIDVSPLRSEEYKERLRNYLSGLNMEETVEKLLENHRIPHRPFFGISRNNIKNRLKKGLKRAAAEFIRRYPSSNIFRSFLMQIGYNVDESLDILISRYEIVFEKMRAAHVR